MGPATSLHRRSTKIALVALLIVAALALALAACGEEEATSNGDESTPKPGGTFYVPIGANPPGIDAVGIQGPGAARAAPGIFDRYTGEGQVRSSAADPGTAVILSGSSCRSRTTAAAHVAAAAAARYHQHLDRPGVEHGERAAVGEDLHV